MSMVGFPLLLIPLAIYNIIVLLMPGVTLAEPLLRLTLTSGAEWQVNLSDILLALGMVLLLFEVIKGARPGAKFLTDHLLSLIVFAAAAAEFMLWPRFATSTFFLLALLSLVDFLSGIALRTRRATITAAVSRQEAPTPAPASEPQFDAPVAVPPAASAPPAGSVADTEPLDHPEPRPVSAPAGSSPEVPSPGLQPSEGSSPSPDGPRR